jgi:hypothetical protein
MVSEQTLLADSSDVSQRWDAEHEPLSHDQLIAGILEINTSVSVDFLNTFSGRELRRYLEHLQMEDGPRGRHTRWFREPLVPAIATREALD